MDLTIAVPVIVALVEVLKKTGLKSKMAPITSVLLGVVGFYFFSDGDMTGRLFEGLVAGLTASGLYSGFKATLS